MTSTRSTRRTPTAWTRQPWDPETKVDTSNIQIRKKHHNLIISSGFQSGMQNCRNLSNKIAGLDTHV